MNKSYQSVINSLGSSRVKISESLAPHTYMKVGGPADLFFTATTKQDLIDAVQTAIKNKVNHFILGGGSNILVSDSGIKGLVIKNRADTIKIIGLSGKLKNQRAGINQAVIEVQAGATVNQLVRFTIEESLKGLEEFLGIPGTVGGAVYNNSHHLDHLIGDHIKEVEVIDQKGKVKTYTQKQMHFAYNYSILQKTKEVVLSVKFQLKSGNKTQLWQKAEAALKRRRDTQPLEFPSSGCMFKNIGKAQALLHNTPNQATSAGFLIDNAGLKGTQIGGAKVSEKHANFIINTGNATAKDIKKLTQLVQKRIKEKYHINLKSEVFFIGE